MLDQIANVTLLSHEHHAVLTLEHMRPFHDRCQLAYKESVRRERANETWPALLADSLDAVRLGERVREADPRIVYFVGATRATAAIMVSRLMLALYHPSHLFLVHVDVKADDSVMGELRRLTSEHPNIHLMTRRRLVQWGAWTMVQTLLDALHTIVSAAVDFDFVVNLSDVDVALRTNEEVVEFLRPYKGRNFVQVHQGTGEWLEKARNFTRKYVVVECGGYGFVAVNGSAIDLGGGPQCCFGRGGPVVYANATELHLPDARAVQDAEMLADAPSGAPSRLRTGSQWVILDRAFATYLVRDERAAHWVRVFERRFLADEAFVQTALMDSPFASTLVNHNLRYIYWPHFDGDPTAYWARMGYSYIGGPQVINATSAPAVFRSPYMFARKFDPTIDAQAIRMWDDWMGLKLKGRHPEDQETLGGTPRAEQSRAPLERAAGRVVEGGRGRTGAYLGGTPVPTRVRPQLRRVERVVFEDGSSCECAAACEANGTCCDDWAELCAQGRAPAGGESANAGGASASAGGDGAGSVGSVDGEPPLPPCPAPTHPPLSSAARDTGRSIRLSFLNHARHPVKLYYRGPPPTATEHEMGSLSAYGPPLTFDATDSQAWVVRAWNGITMLEVPPREGRPSTTVDIFECDLRPPPRPLHHGWRLD